MSAADIPIPCDLLVRADVILTQDGDRRVLTDGAVAVERGSHVTGGRILDVGAGDALAARWAPAETLELGESLLLPGLINAHTHASMTLFRGFADDLPLMEWLGEHIWPVEKELSEELVELGALAACAEMIRTGTTCFTDMYMHERAVGRAVDGAGMRAVLGEAFFAFPSPFFPTAETAWACMRELHAHHENHPRLRTAVAAHALYTNPPEDLAASYRLVEEFGSFWQIHCAETPAETARCLEVYGKRPVALLEEYGLLTERTLLAHCVDLIDEEIALLADRGVHIAHCPESNLKLGSGIARVQDLLDAGANICLGTDGAASNNDLNMFGEMRQAALLQKGVRREPTALPAGIALDMATRAGAAALHWPELGSLEPGRAADMIALDISGPNCMPHYSPVSLAVYAATGLEVRMTMVDGRVLYKDGRFETIDYPALHAEMVRASRWADSRR